MISEQEIVTKEKQQVEGARENPSGSLIRAQRRYLRVRRHASAVGRHAGHHRKGR